MTVILLSLHYIQSPQVETKSKQVGKADPIHNSILREIPALI